MEYRNWAWDDYNLYEAVQGDTFDDIARQAYDDEHLASILLYANPDLADVLVFEGGEHILIPIISEVSSDLLPPWRRGT